VTRLSLSRQLLLLQMLMVVLVVGTVGWVTTVQASQDFRTETERRLLGTADSTASERVVRDALVVHERGPVGVRLERVRVAAGASYVVLVAVDGHVLATSVPGTEGTDLDVRADVRRGASWAGEHTRFERDAVEAQVAVFSDAQSERDYGGEYGIRANQVIGYLVLGRDHPSRLEVIRADIPHVLFYLALAGMIGVGGSLLIARRVKRQTLGLEPREITELMEQREAMLHGVREGVVGVDMAGRVAFASGQADALLGLQPPVRGRPVSDLDVAPEVAAVLCGEAPPGDVVVAVGERLLVLNTQPMHVRGRQTGWVSSMRDRTELVGLEQELAAAQAGTDTLRAQVHEFRNRLHAIAGMAELGRVDQVREFVHTVMDDLDGRIGQVSAQVEDPAVASVLVAKASRADERGITFHLDEDAHLGPQESLLSADLVTVVGNLVDNAFDAVDAGGRVDVDLREEDGRIVVEVSDTGEGISDEDRARVFELGWTTKQGADARSHGFGLALTRMACRRHGGTVTIGQREGAVVRAELLTTPGKATHD
jgi:two-component system, CitB family, sensor kinase